MSTLSGPQLLATIAQDHAGCSARTAVQVYTDVIVRPSDRTPQKISYFLGYGGSPPSTCALFALGCMRLAGLTDPELLDPYVPGNATRDVQTVASRHGVLLRPGSAADLRVGDVWVIDSAAGTDAHVGVCASDAMTQPDGSVEVATVEGGQGPDSSGIQSFLRTWKPSGSLWMLGTRHLICRVDASKLGIPDSSP